MSTIFISHRDVSYDNEWAERIHNWIKDQKNIDGFLDFNIRHGLQAGEKWEDEIYAAMNSARVVIALISQDWLKSDWCVSEARMAKLLGLTLIPIMISECKNPFPEIQTISMENGEERAFDLLRQALQTTHKLPKRPYPGLAAFQEEDAAVFFGRADETRDLLNQVHSLFQGRPDTSRLLLILGASGSGKSSIVRAGLIPEFKTDPKQIAVAPIIPRGAPLKEIAHVLDISLDGLDVDGTADAILASLKSLNPNYERAIITIDQAEELLRGDYSFFYEVLGSVLDKSNGRVVVLATMRSDFLNAFQQSDFLKAFQQRGLNGKQPTLPYAIFALDPLPEERLSDIILEPAKKFGTVFEDGLVPRIIKDHEGLDALPLLAFFLNEFWREDYINDGMLQIAEYESFGGLNQALQKAIDRAIAECARLDPAYTNAQRLRDDLREVFLGVLVSVGSVGGEAVRNRVAVDTLPKQQTKLLTAFAKQRLLIEKEGFWEIVHEALLRQWADLVAWIADAREDLMIIDRIQTASTHCHEAGRQDTDLTHTGNRLSEAGSMLRSPRYANRFLDIDVDYLDACDQKYRDQLALEAGLREQAEQESVRARNGESRARRFTQVAGAVALDAVCAGVVAFWQWRQAEEQTTLAKDAKIYAEKQTASALRTESRLLSNFAQQEIAMGTMATQSAWQYAAYPRILMTQMRGLSWSNLNKYCSTAFTT